ncbi:hypothetical protein GT037_011192 [Alternaria burnsii]|uniref:Uncharacterized protein n=1 Tax=Alternaria burnsii TaxID=1187904 RepID=A0A8H7E8S0_9PLEO|nr:uncharacterized protein GT037_011192 [Alternaria burnsii]KAF7670741.1 hypothetical protein GT037_011192 [Alternaria burnsii]
MINASRSDHGRNPSHAMRPGDSDQGYGRDENIKQDRKQRRPSAPLNSGVA